ncbi:MAG: metal-dependent hydrolase [Bacillota bacterium]
MKIVYEGHACFSLIGSKNVLIDPFIEGNPLVTKTWQDFSPDYILLTHGHGDHLGNALEIADKSGSVVVAQVDLINQLPLQGIETVAFNLGGLVDLGDLKIKMMPAWHGSTYVDNKGCHYGGIACGYLVLMDDLCIYHAGDTGLFGDMKAIIAPHNLDVALLPIGDFYTMGPDDAKVAAAWLGAKTVIPMHYDTFPNIKQDPYKFKKLIETQTDSKCQVLKVGEEIIYKK